MAVFDGELQPDILFAEIGAVVLPPPQWQVVVPFLAPPATLSGTIGAGVIVAPVTVYDGEDAPCFGEDWFEKIIILDRSYDFGILLGTVTDAIEIYNSYRAASQTLTAWSSTAGAGVDIPDMPALPHVILPQDGLVATLTAYTYGPPTIRGDITFTFTALGDFDIPVVGVRAVMIPFSPEAPMVERLRWATDVMVKLNGYEQRAALRDSPRQFFEVTYALDGHECRALATILFDGQGRQGGFPLWHESTVLTSAIGIGDTVAQVESTAYADWRVGSVGIAWADSENFEALQVASVAGASVTFASPFTAAFPAGSLVMPVRAAYFEEFVRGSRQPLRLQRLSVKFAVTENVVDLASVAAFPAYQGKVFLSESNMVEGEFADVMERDREDVDARVGTFYSYSDWGASRRGSAKKFYCSSRRRLWEVRQLLHSLKGRATSFYLPTFWPDLEPTDDLSSASAILQIKNVKYVALVQDRSPLRDVRVVLVNGTTITRRVLSSVEVSAATEELTVDANWGADVALADIDRVEFVEKVRFDSDEVEIRHLDATGQAVVSAPVKTVLE